jgi:arabinofuranosyltransferase
VKRRLTPAHWTLLLLAAAAATTLVHALWISQVTDDAGVSLAYARNVARGDGLRLTPFSPRVEAFSHPLWVVWLSLGSALKLDGPRFAHVSGACAAAAVFLVGLIPSRVERRAPGPLDAIAPWVLALDTTYAFWAGAGLETGAFALALASTMVLLDRTSWSTVPAGLLSLLRPEGALYVVALAAWRGAQATRRWPRTIAWLGMAILPLFAWTIFRKAYYGQSLPNT